MRELPPNTPTRGGFHRPHHIPSWLHRRVFPRCMGTVGLPRHHVATHRCSHGPHDLRVRGDEPRGWDPRAREDV